MAADRSERTEPSITLHSSWLGIVGASLGALCLMAIAVAIVAANGFSLVSSVIAIGAVAVAVVAVLDMPIATRFESDAFERITPFRRRRTRLDDIDRFSRMRRAVRRPGAGRTSATGLVARVGRRQVLLVDRMEGLLEHERLREIIGIDQADRLLHDVVPPAQNRTPTWVGRRRRWKP